MPKQGSTTDPAARIFNMALTSCLKQTASTSSPPANPGNGLRLDDSQKKPVLASTDHLKQNAGMSDPVNPSYGRTYDSEKPMLAITVSGMNESGMMSDRVVYPSNGFGHVDSKSKLVFGSNHHTSPVLNLGKGFQNEVHLIEDRDELVKQDSPDIMIYDTKQKENLVVQSFVNHSSMNAMEQYNIQDSSNQKPRQRMKSVISVINNHLSSDSDCSSRNPALKRSASDCFETRFSSAHKESKRTVFMSERGSDTSLLTIQSKEVSSAIQFTPDLTVSRSNPELVQSESKGMSQFRVSPSDFSGNSSRIAVLKSESYTPLSRFSYKRSENKHHHRRSTYPVHDKRSAADITPFSPTARSSDSSPVRRIKRARTGALIPSYDLKSINLKPPVRVIDSHCHLDFLFTRENYHKSYSNYRSEHSETFPDCYEGCITIFCEPQNFFRKLEWNSVLQEDGVWAAFGCHPHMVRFYSDKAEDALIEALEDPKVIALGEIGLDYSKRNNCDRELQKRVLRRQLRIGLEHKRPLVIHCREAHEDCMEIMKEMVPRDHLIHLHCFTDTWPRANAWLEEFPNLYIGITNVVTFPSAEDVHETARNIPIDRLLLETDTPYFVPRSVSLRWSHPGLVIHAGAQIAAFKNDMQLEDLLRTVRNNTYKVYGI